MERDTSDNNRKKGNGLGKIAPSALTRSNALSAALNENYAAQQRIVSATWYHGYFGHGSRMGARIVRVNGLPLRHFVLHASSMTWGDNSAEAADLACSILWHHVGGSKGIGLVHQRIEVEVAGQRIVATERGRIALQLHMDFLHEVVAHWPREQPWIYTESELRMWLATARKRLVAGTE